MASVRLEYYAWLGRVLGLSTREGRLFVDEAITPGETVRSLLQRLAVRSESFRETIYEPAQDRVRESVALLVNDRAVELAGGLDAPLQDGDNLVFLPGFAGG